MLHDLQVIPLVFPHGFPHGLPLRRHSLAFAAGVTSQELQEAGAGWADGGAVEAIDPKLLQRSLDDLWMVDDGMDGDYL